MFSRRDDIEPMPRSEAMQEAHQLMVDWIKIGQFQDEPMPEPYTEMIEWLGRQDMVTLRIWGGMKVVSSTGEIFTIPYGIDELFMPIENKSDDRPTIT